MTTGDDISAVLAQPTVVPPQVAEKIRAQIGRVQRLVREKAGLELVEGEIVQLALLSLEPEVLARAVVFTVTGRVLELAEDGDDEIETRPAGGAPPP